MTEVASKEKDDVIYKDALEEMLKRTGCIDLHYAVQECFYETQDWRKCQEQVQKFRICMNKHREELEKRLQ